MIYLDATNTLLQWKGAATGVQRVVLNLLSEASQKDEAQAVAWVPGGGGQRGWFLLDAGMVEEVRGLPTRVETRQGRASWEWMAASARVGVELLGFGPFRALRGKWEAMQRGILGMDGLSPRARFIMRHGRPVEWARGDVLLNADCNWAVPGFEEALKGLCDGQGAKVATIVYDLIPLLHPYLYPDGVNEGFRRWTRTTLKCSSHLLTISQFVEGSLRGFAEEEGVSIVGKTIRAVQLGNAFEECNKEGRQGGVTAGWLADYAAKESGEEGNLDLAWRERREWLLWVGTLDQRKNLETVLYALEPLWGSGALKMPLVVVGRCEGGYETLMRRLRRDSRLNRHLIYVGRAPDELLGVLYRQAWALIHSAWSEGYGLPVAEAMQHGVPCLVSNADSLPEVAGSRAEYFDPWHPEELRALVKKLAGDADFYEEMRARARTFQATSWRECWSEIREALTAGVRGSQAGVERVTGRDVLVNERKPSKLSEVRSEQIR